MPHPTGWIWPPARDLDLIAREVAAEWGLTLGARFPGARYSFAAPADGAVLKIRPVEDDESDHEPDALEAWEGEGAVRLLRQDRARRAMLVERAIPGDDASALADDVAIRVALDVGARLWRRVDPGPFRSAHSEVRRWLARVRPSGHRYVAVAQRIFARIDPREDALIHGDYHHHNLLRHGGRWVAIDPKPLLGEPEFDVVTLLWNPTGHVPTRESIERRIAAFARAGLDEGRIRDWAVVRGTYLGLPLDPGENEDDVRQLSVARCVLGG